ncbi:MAG: hypothetical protein SGBAC_007995 [Bacillariaceae sp.]
MSEGMEMRVARTPLSRAKKLFRKSDSKTEASTLHGSFSSEGGLSFKTGSNHSQKDPDAECLKKLQRFFTEDSTRSISDDIIFRFACFHDFEYWEAFVGLQEYDANRRLHLRMDGELLTQFQTKTIFPLPGLKTKDYRCNVFYMRPSRYIPAEMSTSNVVDNLCFVLNDLSQTKEECQNGVAFIANMKGWTMKNFSHDYCFQFMQALQGKQVPTKVELFLIVNPPAWFGRVWKVVRPMLSKSFSRKVHIIKEHRLGEFLMPGYEKFLPDEFSCGYKDAAEICEDYEDLKYHEDELH